MPSCSSAVEIGMVLTAYLLCRPKVKRTKKRAGSGADDSGALAEAELTALEADIAQLQVRASIRPAFPLV